MANSTADAALECDYQGRHFGAAYPDAQCVDGFLWDEDSCDEPGGVLMNGGDIPCPKCNSAGYAEYFAEAMSVPVPERTAANATHRLICHHVCRWTKKYGMRCHILKTMPDGRLKLLVFGERNWKDRDHISRTRYVEASRVEPISPSAS